MHHLFVWPAFASFDRACGMAAVQPWAVSTAPLSHSYLAGMFLSSALMVGAGYSGGEMLLATEADDGPAASTKRPSFTLDPSPQLATGRQLFLKNCAHCHGADARGDEGPDLRNLDWTDEQNRHADSQGKERPNDRFCGKVFGRRHQRSHRLLAHVEIASTHTNYACPSRHHPVEALGLKSHPSHGTIATLKAQTAMVKSKARGSFHSRALTLAVTCGSARFGSGPTRCATRAAPVSRSREAGESNSPDCGNGRRRSSKGRTCRLSTPVTVTKNAPFTRFRRACHARLICVGIRIPNAMRKAIAAPPWTCSDRDFSERNRLAPGPSRSASRPKRTQIAPEINSTMATE